MTYITPSRGKWYYAPGKETLKNQAELQQILFIHFFDLLTWIFGDVKENVVHLLRPEKAAEILYLQKARVRWFLSLDYQDISQTIREKGLRTFRSLTVENEEVEFSEGFTDLHTESYRQLLAGKGFGMEDARNSVEMPHQIRNSTPIGITGDYHPILKLFKR